ncbi:MAG: hypothetical protein ISR55_11380 [Bacteroidetes bacterium]|nr:hypothetical protein [Bacteroidota bacterium]
MKKIENFLGLFGFILFFVAIFFKFYHYPGAAILRLAGTTLGIIYFATSFFSKDLYSLKGIEKMNGMTVALAMIFFLISFLFKTNHWPGGDILLEISLLTIAIYMLSIIISIFSVDKLYNTALINRFKFSILYFAAVLIMFGMRAYS